MIADYHWLTSVEAGTLLEFTRRQLDAGVRELSILQQLRKTNNPDQSRQVLSLAKLRIKAARKFVNSNQMFFTETNLQQATGESVAGCKASRFSRSDIVFDLCCGIGGDLLGLARRNDHVVGIDRDEVCCEFARANLAANDLNAEVLATRIDLEQIPAEAVVHIDPSRREEVGHQTRKTTRLEHYQPPLQFLDELIQQQSGVAIKLAPATEVPAHWQRGGELQWIGHENQCKQQVLWSGKLARHPSRKTVIVIDRNQVAHEFIGQQPTEYRVQEPRNEIEKFILEPHAAVRAAGLESDLGESLNAGQLPVSPSYLTSDEVRATPFGTWFEVMGRTTKKKLPHDLQALNPGDIEFKCRPPFDALEKMKKTVSLHGDSIATVIAFRLHDHSEILICRRI